MQIAEVMTPAPVTVSPDDTVAEAARRLHKHQVSAVGVTEGDRPIGIVSERDLVRLGVDGPDPTVTPVRGRMPAPLHTLPADPAQDESAPLMARPAIAQLPPP